jgi:hypothetical protein
MPKVNIWHRFSRLLPAKIQLIGEITAHNADGTSRVELPGGGITNVKGQSVAIGDKAFIEDGWIVGEAPDLPSYITEV